MQIEEDVKSQENTHPLAVRRIIKDMCHIQLTEAREIAKQNEEIIVELTEEKKSIMVGNRCTCDVKKEFEEMNIYKRENMDVV